MQRAYFFLIKRTVKKEPEIEKMITATSKKTNQSLREKGDNNDDCGSLAPTFGMAYICWRMR